MRSLRQSALLGKKRFREEKGSVSQREFMWGCFLTWLSLSESTSRKAPSSTQTGFFCWVRGVLFTQEAALWTTNEGKEKNEERGLCMGFDGGLWAGTDNRSGFPGDTNFSVQGSPLPGYHHHPALPHQSPFSPDRADQWPRVMVVCPFVRWYSMARHCDGSTRPKCCSQRKVPPSNHYAKCTFGGAGCCLGGFFFLPLEYSFLKSVQQVKKGIRCIGGRMDWGLGIGCFVGTDTLVPHWVVRRSQSTWHILLCICQVDFCN